METSSTVIKKNFIWSSILTISGYLFPLITYPYVSRVLGVASIGKFQFATSIISYFNVIAMMGIATIGIREIARAKGKRKELSGVFSSLVSLNLISTCIAISLLVICIYVVPSFNNVKKMLYIGTANIFCNSLMVEWLYKGLEDFRYITFRGILIRCIYVGCVLLFVKNQDDYVVYFLLTTLVVVVNSAINICHSRKYIDFSFENINFRPYVKSFIILGVYQILTAMYISFNVIFLGARCGDVEVGYYSTATKLYGLIMSFFTAFTGVMLPRMSSLIEEKKNNDFVKLAAKSIDFLLLFSIPIIVISEVYAPFIVRVISGAGYDGAILPMRIVMPLLLIIGYEQILVIQMLTPLRKDSEILKNSVIGAFVALLLNITIVSKLGSVGSSIVWCCSELAVLLSTQRIIQKYIGFKMPILKIVSTILLILPSVFLCLLINNYIKNLFFQFVVGSAVIIVYFAAIEIFALKNELPLNNIRAICRKVSNK